MEYQQIINDINNLTGIELSKQAAEQILSFEKLFNFYNSHTNLVSKNDEKLLYPKHIYDSIALSLFFNKYNVPNNIRLLDIGTGGGFPSIPLSLVYPDMQIFPLDSIAKKIGFVELVQKELRLDNMSPICSRVEDLSVDFKASFDVVTSRAVASLNTLLEYTIPFVKVGSYFVAYKSRNVDIELDEAQQAMKILGCELVDRIKYNLPHEESLERVLVVIRKNIDTDPKYPRKMGLAKKNPL